MILAMMISVLVAAANASPGLVINFKDIITVVTGIGGVVFGVIAAKRTNKADKVSKEQTEVTSLITGYTSQLSAYADIVESLQQEVLRLRTQFEIDRQEWEYKKADLANEKKEWETEKKRLQDSLKKKPAIKREIPEEE